MENDPTVSMLHEHRKSTSKSLYSTNARVEVPRKTSNTKEIKASPKRWLIVILFFIFSANTAFQV